MKIYDLNITDGKRTVTIEATTEKHKLDLAELVKGSKTADNDTYSVESIPTALETLYGAVRGLADEDIKIYVDGVRKEWRKLTAREIRQRTGLSQAKFADRYGIPKRTIESWEEGIRECPDYVLTLLLIAIEAGR